MRVFNYASGADTAGIVSATAFAFRRHTDWDVSAMVASQNYIGYPVDVPWSQLELERLYDAADVVHIHNTTHAHRWYDNGAGKPTVLMHHGMHSEAEYRGIVADARNRGMVQVGSTLDLSVLEPEVEWLPAPVNLVRMRAIRAQGLADNAEWRDPDVVRIGHAPTNRGIKGSDAFDAAIAALRGSGLAVEAVVIQGKPWQDCLRLKATCDLMFDQPVLGYGSNAIEAWAMGIPVIAGVQSPEVREAMLARWGVLPFAEATVETIERVMRALVADADLRAEYASRGTAHVTRWHAEEVTVRSLQAIYAAAGPTVPGGSERRYSEATLAKIRRHHERDRAALDRKLRRRLVVAR